METQRRTGKNATWQHRGGDGSDASASVHPRFFLELILTLVVEHWWFSNSVIPFTFISWNSSGKKRPRAPDFEYRYGLIDLFLRLAYYRHCCPDSFRCLNCPKSNHWGLRIVTWSLPSPALLPVFLLNLVNVGHLLDAHLSVGSQGQRCS